MHRIIVLSKLSLSWNSETMYSSNFSSVAYFCSCDFFILTQMHGVSRYWCFFAYSLKNNFFQRKIKNFRTLLQTAEVN